jgi:hypothetical protein
VEVDGGRGNSHKILTYSVNNMGVANPNKF